MPIPFLLSEQAFAGETPVQQQLRDLMITSDRYLGINRHAVQAGVGRVYNLPRCRDCRHALQLWSLPPVRGAGRRIQVCLHCKGAAGAPTVVRC